MSIYQIELGIVLPTINSIDSLFKASAIIYQQFGELYDIPLFAYEDLKEVCALKTDHKVNHCQGFGV